MTEMHELLLDELRAGRRVIVAVETGREARRVFVELADPRLLPDDGIQCVSGRGQERITHPSGGWARFMGVASGSWRGLTADTILVLGQATDLQLRDMAPCMHDAADPKLVLR